MDLEFSTDEEIVCVTENDACGVDAIQFITGCTFGKGNLLYRDRGKAGLQFLQPQDGGEPPDDPQAPPRGNGAGGAA